MILSAIIIRIFIETKQKTYLYQFKHHRLSQTIQQFSFDLCINGLENFVVQPSRISEGHLGTDIRIARGQTDLQSHTYKLLINVVTCRWVNHCFYDFWYVVNLFDDDIIHQYSFESLQLVRNPVKGDNIAEKATESNFYCTSH